MDDARANSSLAPAPRPTLNTAVAKTVVSSSSSAASQAARDGSLYPPRDKPARRLWDTLLTFKKRHGHNVNAHQVLEAEGSYLRACAHHFAERLGLAHETHGEGAARTVDVGFLPRVQRESKAEVSRKRKAEALAAAESSKRAEAAAEPAGSSAPPSAAAAEEPGEPAAAAAPAAPSVAVAAAARPPPAAGKRGTFYLQRFAQCAKKSDAAAAQLAWQEMVEEGVPCTGKMASILLHVYLEAEGNLLQPALNVFAAARAAASTPDESCWSGLVRMHCAAGDTRAALDTIDEMVSAGVTPRLRTYSPILVHARVQHDRTLAHRTVRALNGHGLLLGVAEYLDLLTLEASSEPHHVTTLLRRMSTDCLALEPAHAETLLATFGAVAEAEPAAAATDAAAADAAASSPAAAAAPRWIAAECRPDPRGLCSCRGIQLGPVLTTAQEMTELCSNIPRLIGPRAKLEVFSQFTHWLESDILRHGPYQYVLDGANIGYFGQAKKERERKLQAQKGREAGKGGGGSSSHAARAEQSQPLDSTFSLQNVERLRLQLRQQQPDARVLLVLHRSHTEPSGKPLEPSDAALVAHWQQHGLLYTSPGGMNDDWYWLHAALTCGEGCHVISNDEMRDHHFGLLHHRSFRTWKERHVLHFTFEKAHPPQPPTILAPPPFSHAMQEAPDGTWHLPCAEPEEGRVAGRWLSFRPA